MDYFTVLLVLLVLIGLYLIVAFNKLVILKNNRTQAFADIDVQLKKRYDLIPNLVEVTKGYAKHEQSTFEEIAKVRTEAMQGGSIEQRAQKENVLENTLHSLFALAEAYPKLKANEQFLALQNELSDIESSLAAARRFFNHATKEFNSMIQSFPIMLFAGIFGFHSETFFSTEDKENINITF